MDTKYCAFISYRHLARDMSVAKRIHRRIERYVIPKALRKDGNKHVGRVFRDQDELPMCGDLSESIYLALDHSEYLIVICTPQTDRSEWVRREITYFLEKHDRDHVLVVLAAGTPTESFPPALTEIRLEDGSTVTPFEPLAANISPDTIPKGSHSFRTESLRILAALIGCSFDTLFKREQRYKRRRFGAILAAAALIVAGFTGMLLNRNLKIRENFDNALRTQSAYLAAESEKLRTDGDRFGAIWLALQALPDARHTRPLVSRAELALQIASGAYSSGGMGLQTTAMLPSSQTVYDFALDDSGRYLCAFQDGNALIGWDTKTLQTIWKMPLDGFAKIAGVVRKTDLLVWTSNDLYCIRMSDGKILWRRSSKDCFADESDVLSLHQIDLQCVYAAKNDCIVVGAWEKIARMNANGEREAVYDVDASMLGVTTNDSYFYLDDDLTVSDDGERVAFSFRYGDDLMYSETGVAVLNADGSVAAVQTHAPGYRVVSAFAFADHCLYYCEQEEFSSIVDSAYSIDNTTQYRMESNRLHCLDLTTGEIRWTSDEHVNSQPSGNEIIRSFADSAPTPCIAFAYANCIDFVDPKTGDVYTKTAFSSRVTQLLQEENNYVCLTQNGGRGLVDKDLSDSWLEAQIFRSNAKRIEPVYDGNRLTAYWLLCDGALLRYGYVNSDANWVGMDLPWKDDTEKEACSIENSLVSEDCFAFLVKNRSDSSQVLFVSDGDPSHPLQRVELAQALWDQSLSFVDCRDGVLRVRWTDAYKKSEPNGILYIETDSLSQKLVTFDDPDTTLVQLYAWPDAETVRWIAPCTYMDEKQAENTQTYGVCVLDESLQVQTRFPVASDASRYADPVFCMDASGKTLYVLNSKSRTAFCVDVEKQTAQACPADLTAAFLALDQNDRELAQSVFFDPSQRYVAVQPDEKTVRVLLPDGTERFTLSDPERRILSVSFSSDGQYLLTVESDKFLRRYALSDGAFVGETDILYAYIGLSDTIRWYDPGDGYLALDCDGDCTLIRLQDWSAFSCIQNCCGYQPKRGFVMCQSLSTGEYGGFYRYSTDDLIAFGRSILNGWEMPQAERRQYGLD